MPNKENINQSMSLSKPKIGKHAFTIPSIHLLSAEANVPSPIEPSIKQEVSEQEIAKTIKIVKETKDIDASDECNVLDCNQGAGSITKTNSKPRKQTKLGNILDSVDAIISAKEKSMSIAPNQEGEQNYSLQIEIDTESEQNTEKDKNIITADSTLSSPEIKYEAELTTIGRESIKDKMPNNSNQSILLVEKLKLDAETAIIECSGISQIFIQTKCEMQNLFYKAIRLVKDQVDTHENNAAEKISKNAQGSIIYIVDAIIYFKQQESRVIRGYIAASCIIDEQFNAFSKRHTLFRMYYSLLKIKDSDNECATTSPLSYENGEKNLQEIRNQMRHLISNMKSYASTVRELITTLKEFSFDHFKTLTELSEEKENINLLSSLSGESKNLSEESKILDTLSEEDESLRLEQWYNLETQENEIYTQDNVTQEDRINSDVVAEYCSETIAETCKKESIKSNLINQDSSNQLLENSYAACKDTELSEVAMRNESSEESDQISQHSCIYIKEKDVEINIHKSSFLLNELLLKPSKLLTLCQSEDDIAIQIHEAPPPSNELLQSSETTMWWTESSKESCQTIRHLSIPIDDVAINIDVPQFSSSANSSSAKLLQSSKFLPLYLSKAVMPQESLSVTNVAKHNEPPLSSSSRLLQPSKLLSLYTKATMPQESLNVTNVAKHRGSDTECTII